MEKISTRRIARSRPVITTRKAQRGHVIAKPPTIDISGPGRLRSKHVLALCGLSHSTLYKRMSEGDFPKYDGKDGRLNYWNTATIRGYLNIDTLH